MKTLKNTLVTLIAITALSTNAFAGSIGIGIAGQAVSVTADGTETPGGVNTGVENSVTTATAGNEAMLGSVFAEINFGDDERFTVGLDYIPGDADVSSKTHSRVDPASGDSNDTAGTKKAQATLSDHITYYAEYVVTNGIYLKGGFSQVDVKTTQTTFGTSSKYGTKTLDAWTVGLGQKGTFGTNGFYKVEGFMTDYDTFKATGTGASTTGASTNSTVSADLDVLGAAFRLGYKF